mgnify:FL=1
MMNKKYFLQAMAMMLGVVLSVSFVSCGDDDEDDSGSSTPAVSNSVLSSRLKDVNGKTLLLTAVGDNEYRYASNGSLLMCGWLSNMNSKDRFMFDGLNYTAGDDEIEVDGRVELNRDGLVSKGYCNIKESYNESGIIEWTCSWEFTCTYNSEKQLQKIEATTHQEHFDENGQLEHSGEELAILTYTWTDGNLVKVVTTYQESGHVSDDFFKPMTVTYSYGNEENVTRQPLKCQEMLYDRGFMELNVLGLYGIGPRNFPISYTLERNTYKSSESISFTLNDDGSINTETVSRYDAYQYTYMK